VAPEALLYDPELLRTRPASPPTGLNHLYAAQHRTVLMHVHKDSKLRSRPFHKAALLGCVLEGQSGFYWKHAADRAKRRCCATGKVTYVKLHLCVRQSQISDASSDRAYWHRKEHSNVGRLGKFVKNQSDGKLGFFGRYIDFDGPEDQFS